MAFFWFRDIRHRYTRAELPNCTDYAYCPTIREDRCILASEFHWQPSEINAMNILQREEIAARIIIENRQRQSDNKGF